MGDDILAATDLEDLRERLDAACADDGLADLGPARKPVDFTAPVPPLDVASLKHVLGLGPTRKIEDADARLRSTAYPLILRLARRSERKPANVTTLSEMLYDTSVPRELRGGILRLCRGMAATIAIARAEEHGRRIEPWLAMGLADEFHAWAMFLANLVERATSPFGLMKLGRRLLEMVRAHRDIESRAARLGS